MGENPTGNGRALNFNYPPIVRMSVTYIEQGEYSFEEMLEGIERGLYVIGTLGGQTELEMFTFSARLAYLIEKGRIGPLVRDVVLSGNVFDTLNNIEMIGNDLKIHGGIGGCGKRGQFPLPISDGGPHIRIKGVVVGGS
jgi:TldD protein